MKRLSFILIFFAFILTGYSQKQSPWNGFIRPLDTFEYSTSPLEITWDDNGIQKELLVSNYPNWLFRPTVTLTAMQFIPDKELGMIVKSLQSMGLGVSYNHYRIREGELYSDYGINALLLFDYDPLGEMAANIQIAVAVTAFQLVNVGIGYSPKLKKPFIITGITYAFGQN